MKKRFSRSLLSVLLTALLLCEMIPYQCFAVSPSSGEINTEELEAAPVTETPDTDAYDALGKPLEVSRSLASMVGEVNPLRHRIYYYDPETGLYYLNNVSA